MTSDDTVMLWVISVVVGVLGGALYRYGWTDGRRVQEADDE